MPLWQVILIGWACLAALVAAVYFVAMPLVIRRYNEMRLQMMPAGKTRL